VPLIDVDLILENNRDELELFWVFPDVSALNASAYNDYLKQNFVPWPYVDSNNLTTGEVIARQYQNTTLDNVTRSFYDLQTDIGIYCANLELGKIAATNFKKSVYISVNNQAPSYPMSVDPFIPPLADPIHMWDFIAVSDAWDFWASPGGNVLTPNSSQGAVPTYEASGEDRALRDLLRRQFNEFIINGVITNGMSPINNVTGGEFPTNVNVAVHQLDDTRTTVVVNTKDYRSDYCNLLKTVGLEPNGANGPINDGRFWWIN